MLSWPEGTRLLGDHFICEVVRSNATASPLVTLEQDPRKMRLKPDAFPVTVEAVGPDCRLVQPGDKIVLERWQYDQHDIDNGRLIASEREILIRHGSIPAPGVIVVDVLDEKKPTGLSLPPSVKPAQKKYVHGRVYASSHYLFKKGWEAWFERAEEGQYKFLDKIIWRVDERSALAVREPGPILEVV